MPATPMSPKEYRRFIQRLIQEQRKRRQRAFGGPTLFPPPPPSKPPRIRIRYK
jgi:hypothetical protein